MADEMYDGIDDVFGGTVELVSAYVFNSTNRLAPDEFQALIRETFATLSNLTAVGPVPVAEPQDFTKSKAEVRKSIGSDKLISFIDGRGYSSLKRHLTSNGHTPETYRETYGLPRDYPITHPAYSARRSELAKSIGLGQKGRASRATAPAMTAKPRRLKAAKAEPTSAR